MTPRTWRVGLVLGLGAGTVGAQENRHAVDYKLTLTTKILCSAVFVSERDPVEAIWNSGHLADMPHEPAKLRTERRGNEVRFEYRFERPGLVRFTAPRITTDFDRYLEIPLQVTVDRKARVVTARMGDHRAKARFWGDQGCVAQRPDQDSVYFTPRNVVSALPPAASQPWPMGDAPAAESGSSAISKAAIDEVADLAFAPGAHTAGMVIVHRGRIIGERYAEGAHRDMQLESWSMGKSVTATLLGILIADGRFKRSDPAPVPAWHVLPDDPRREIRIEHLLRMSSGLRFTSDEAPHTWSRLESDHIFVYTGLADVFHHSITQPLEHPPNTVGRYRNSDPLTLGYLIRRSVEQSGDDYHAWPQKALFDRIGVRRQVLETDMYGNFVMTGYDYGTPRNWARLGLLWLRDGVWEGRRILPEGYVDFVRAPAPAWGEPTYGGQFWLNGDCSERRAARGCRNPNDPPSKPEFAKRRWNLPADAYFMAGGGGQFVVIVPSLDLVVVRMGHWRGISRAEPTLNRAFGRLVEVLPVR